MRIVLCDDNRILCEALADALRARCHQVLAVTTTVAEGIAAVDAHKPDACVLDLRFSDGHEGLYAAQVIRDRYPDTRILVLSGLSEPAAWSQALQLGVAGFLRKDQNVDQIADALDVIAEGGVVFDPTISGRRASPPARPQRDPLRMLTPREKEVLRRIVAGQSTRQMASEMSVAASTVRSYVKNVLAKLGTHSRLQAAALGSKRVSP